MPLYIGSKSFDLGDRVAYRAKALNSSETKFFGCVTGLFLNGEIQIRSDEGMVHKIRASAADVTQKASELRNPSTYNTEQ